MNKMLLSTAKVAVLFTVSTFFAYMILKTQIKNSSKRTKAAVAAKKSNVEVEAEAESNTTHPVLTYVASTKAETRDIDLGVEDLEMVDFHSSKAGTIGDLDRIIISPSAFNQPNKKKYVELEKVTEPKEFFHTSKAVLTTIVVENVEEYSEPEKPVYFPTSKSAPIDILSEANDEAPNSSLRKANIKKPSNALIEAETLQLQVFELEDTIRQLKVRIAKLRQ